MNKQLASMSEHDHASMRTTCSNNRNINEKMDVVKIHQNGSLSSGSDSSSKRSLEEREHIMSLTIGVSTASKVAAGGDDWTGSSDDESSDSYSRSTGMHNCAESQKPPAKKLRTYRASLLEVITPLSPSQEREIILREEDEMTARRIILPPPESANDPDDYLMHLLSAMYPDVKLYVKPALELDTYFPVIAEDQMARYSMQVVNMVRSNDLLALQQFHTTNGRSALDCFNRFGEGLLNMACRRGFAELCHYLMQTVELTVRVRDDFGRTPLHDACWNPDPQLDICTWIVQRDPSLFLVADKRGYTPFQYARQSDWPVWRQFLYDNAEHLRQLASDEIAETFRRGQHS